MTKLRTILEGIYAIFREFGRDIVIRDYKRYLRKQIPNVNHPPRNRKEQIEAYESAARLGGNSPDMWRGKDR